MVLFCPIRFSQIKWSYTTHFIYNPRKPAYLTNGHQKWKEGLDDPEWIFSKNSYLELVKSTQEQILLNHANIVVVLFLFFFFFGMPCYYLVTVGIKLSTLHIKFFLIKTIQCPKFLKEEKRSRDLSVQIYYRLMTLYHGWNRIQWMGHIHRA